MKKITASLLALLILCGSLEARKVSGSVVSGEQKLSGVVVTDGTNFTQTKKNGKFKFDIEDNAEFVYIITPAGYAADWTSGVPAFFQRAEGKNKFVFELQKTEMARDYNIIAVGDPQPKTQEHFEKFAGKPLEALSNTCQSLAGKAVGLALGDMCWDVPELLESWKKEIVRTGIPFYPVVGNHDHDKYAEGDLNGTAVYREIMGPENYAFFVGKDIVFVVDNIIYKAKRKYDEGYAPHVLAFVKGMMQYVPADADIYVAQHSPIVGRNTTGRLLSPENDGRWKAGAKILNYTDMFDLLRKHKVTFLSGHNHVSGYYEFDKDIAEHNIASICGTWWDGEHCTDGTPRGFKVFTKENGKLSWYFQPVDHSSDYQMEIFRPGQTLKHPNAVIVNIWDWNPGWKVEWYEDGKFKGAMDKVVDYSTSHVNDMMSIYRPLGKSPSAYRLSEVTDHCFAAVPSQYSKNVTVSVESSFGKKWVYNVDLADYVDVQAHRGGAGLMPENTVEAMKHCLDMGVNTLELDLQLSKDGLVVVSHDAYFHSRYALRPDGSEVLKTDPKEYLYTMNYEDILKYDVGSRKSEVWPKKACFPAVKPLATDLIDFVENYTKEKGLTPVRYNIEVKSKDGKGEGKDWPYYHELADAVMRVLLSKKLGDRLVVQCFDHRALNYMYEKYPEIHYSYLVDAKAPDFDTYMAKLRFTPEWLSPHYSITNEELVRKCREKGIKLVPWTVDDPEDIKRMIDLGVEAIISNYPDRLLMQTRGFVFHDRFIEE